MGGAGEGEEGGEGDGGGSWMLSAAERAERFELQLGLERGRAAGYGAGATADEAEEEVVEAVLPLFEAGWRERWGGSGGAGGAGDGGGGGGGGATEGGGGGGDGLALPRAMALDGRIFSAADGSGGATSAAATRAALRASPGNDSSDYSRQSLR